MSGHGTKSGESKTDVQEIVSRMITDMKLGDDGSNHLKQKKFVGIHV